MKIEKNIPVPAKNISIWGDLDVGDSVLADYKASQSAHQFGLRHNKKFASRTVEGGIRIWRIE